MIGHRCLPQDTAYPTSLSTHRADWRRMAAGASAMQRAVVAPHTNLPLRRTSLIGRDQELTALRELAVRAEGRLVTLTGAGGSGKTSLALEVGRSLLDEFPDGVWLADLAPLADTALVTQAVA